MHAWIYNVHVHETSIKSSTYCISEYKDQNFWIKYNVMYFCIICGRIWGYLDKGNSQGLEVRVCLADKGTCTSAQLLVLPVTQ